MSETRPRLTIMTTFFFLCILVFAVSSSVQADSGEMIDLKGTGSAGSFSYGGDSAKKESTIGYGVNHHKSEGSNSKSYRHGSKGYSGHISGSNSHKKQEGSKSKSYSHGKPGHGKSNYGTKSGHGKSYGHKKSEGSQSKSYSHGKPGHGKSSHAARDPWNGRSALDGIEIMNYGVNMMREHIIEEARIHYVIRDGGVQPNVVPSYSRVWYYVRAPNRSIVNELSKRVRQCAQAGAIASETEFKETLLTGVYETLPNIALANCIQRNLELVGGQKYSEEENELIEFFEMYEKEKIPYINLFYKIPPDKAKINKVPINIISRVFKIAFLSLFD